MATMLPLPTATALPERDSARKGVRLQITRRGRVLLTTLVFLAGILVALLAVFVLDVPSAFAGDAQEPATVTVRAGDTLSDYAQRYAPADQDSRDFVREVRELNGLSSPRITEGQSLELPAGSLGAA
jgi:hypothetical protein